MATASVPNVFIPNTVAHAGDVNANFDSVTGFLNTAVVQRDGSTPFTALQSGPAINPTTDNQLARKAYVDQQVAGVIHGIDYGQTWQAASGNGIYAAVDPGVIFSPGAFGITPTWSGPTTVSVSGAATFWSQNASGDAIGAVRIGIAFATVTWPTGAITWSNWQWNTSHQTSLLANVSNMMFASGTATAGTRIAIQMWCKYGTTAGNNCVFRDGSLIARAAPV